jgi:oligopeptidase A
MITQPSEEPSQPDHSRQPDSQRATPEGTENPLDELSGRTTNMNEQAMSENPLTQYNPKIPFDRIEPQHIVPAMEASLQLARETLQSIAQEPVPTFTNTIVALDKALQHVHRCAETSRHMLGVSHTDALQEEVDKIEPLLATFDAELETDSELFRVLTEYSTSQEYQTLSDPRKAAVDRRLQRMELAGAGLPEDQKRELIRLEGQLATLTTRFMSNLLKSTNAYELIVTDESRLAGLPDSALAAAKDSAEKAGQQGHRFTLQAPSVIPVLRYADDASLREEILTAYSRRASEGEYDSTSVVQEILKVRQQKAELLGRDNIAQQILADRMAGSEETAREMGTRLRAKSQAAFEQSVDKLVQYKRAVEGDSAALKPWDVSYYTEKLRQEELNFNAEELRPYFALDNVMQGAFDLAEQLFNVKIEEIDGYPVPHDSVKVYSIVDSDGQNLGHFYSDFIVREEKRAGAWMQPISSTATLHDDAESAVGVICGNMTAPVDDQPALLTHDEVTTVFHEFGHLLHGMLYRGELASQSGMTVEWDFIELPSQLMENWCWTREGLDLFARHKETGETIPDELLEKLQASRTFMSAIHFQRQLGLAEMDFALHCDYNPAEDGDPVTYSREILNQYSAAPSETSAMINSFHHLMGEPTGYACGYYSYRWAEVAEADVFERAVENEVFDSTWGEHYKNVVFRNGSILPAKEIYRRLMGRDPDEDALLRREQLIEE